MRRISHATLHAACSVVEMPLRLENFTEAITQNAEEVHVITMITMPNI